MMLNDSPFCTEVLMRVIQFISHFFQFFHSVKIFLGPHRKEVFIAFSISFLLYSSTMHLSFSHFIHPIHSAYHTFVWVLLSISQFISLSPLSVTRRRKWSSQHRRLTYKIIGMNRWVKLKLQIIMIF
jgi:hypothetical protein